MVTIGNSAAARRNRQRKILDDIIEEKEQMQQSGGSSSRGSRSTPSGVAPDIQRRGEGLDNGYGVSQQGLRSEKLQELDRSPGTRFYNEVYNRAMQNPNLEDRLWAGDVLNEIERDRMRDYRTGAPDEYGAASDRLYNALEVLGQVTDIDDDTLYRLFRIANTMSSPYDRGISDFPNPLYKRLGY